MIKENTMKNFQRNFFGIMSVSFFCSLTVFHAAAQTAAADNKVAQTITYRPIPKSPDLLGVFQGRPPCPLAEQWQLPVDKDCEKVKTELQLYHDPVSKQPTTYTISFVGAGDIVHQYGGTYRWKTITGKWSVIKGIPSNPAAIVYRLETGRPGAYFYLLKGDENVLFILDDNKAFRNGNEDFSYTLNRVELVAAKK